MYNNLIAFQLLKKHIDSSFLYYKSLLTISEQFAYDSIVTGLLQYNSRIRVQKHDFPTIERIIEMIRLDIPGLFYIKDFTFYQYGDLREVIPNYRFSRMKTANTLIAIYDTIRVFIDTCSKYDDTKKVTAVHDLLCKNVEYIDNNSDADHECVGPLLYRSGVCEGISKAAKLLFDLLGVHSILIRGQTVNNSYADSSGSHMWNMVKNNNLFYHMDITFDLSLMEYCVIRYDYFCLSDTQIRIDHIFSKDKPQCNYNWNYYEKNGVYFSNFQLFQNYVNRMILMSKNDIVFQIPTDRFAANISVIKDNIAQIISCYPKISAYELFHNEISGVCHLHLRMRYY